MKGIGILLLCALGLGCGGAPTTARATGPKGPRVIVRDGKIETIEPVTFENDSDTLTKESQKLLDEVGDAIKTVAELRRVRIEGHTDESGDREHNLELSQRRALAVKNYLVQHAGCQAERLETLGHGRDQPISDNSTREGRQRNRRVEFILLDR